eukprot:1058836-Rhodomonas_salina.1
MSYALDAAKRCCVFSSLILWQLDTDAGERGQVKAEQHEHEACAALEHRTLLEEALKSTTLRCEETLSATTLRSEEALAEAALRCEEAAHAAALWEREVSAPGRPT